MDGLAPFFLETRLNFLDRLNPFGQALRGHGYAFVRELYPHVSQLPEYLRSRRVGYQAHQAFALCCPPEQL
jgi:hypothetical protein